MSDTLTVYVYDPDRYSKEIAAARVPPKEMAANERVAYIEGFHKGMEFMVGGREIVLEPTNYGLGYPDNLFIVHGLEVSDDQGS